jgi:hypothetical protein
MKTIKTATNENYEADEDESEVDNHQTPIEELLVVPYLLPIALADSYPVPGTQDYYTKIANSIDEKTDELKRSIVLNTTEQRWKIIASLHFPEVNAADPKQDLSLLFQRTTDFERFLDETNCLIRGRKGTGKTAMYWLFLQHKNVAQKLAHGRLDNTVSLSAHGRFQESRPSRDEFQECPSSLAARWWHMGSFLESLFTAAMLSSKNPLIFRRGKKGAKFSDLKTTINNLPQRKMAVRIILEALVAVIY